MDQTTALNILKTGANVFLTGSAGVGKSYTLKVYLDYLKARNVPYAITASTGIAATNIDGQTIHSWTGIGIKSHITQTHVDKIKKNQIKYMKIIKARVLVIDEISMLHKDQFEAIDFVLRRLRQSEKPFGGLQVILAGDGLQLPPVSTNGEANRDKFCFMSPVWVRANFKSCYLTKQYRQADGDKLNDILNAIRSQTVTQEHIDIIAATSSNTLTNPLKLYTHNRDVTAINKQHFDALPGIVYTNKAKTTGKSIFVDMLKANIKAPEVLELKLNTKVMFVKNDNINGQYANGSQGTVVGFERFNGQYYPKVKLTTGLTVTADPVEWRFENNGAGNTATYTQVPLTLAYAITVHKCIHPDTYVNTTQGLLQIKDIQESGAIQTEFEVLPYVNKVNNHLLTGKEIICERNYSIKVTDSHKCLAFTGDSWNYVEAKELIVGQWLKLKLNQTCNSPYLKLSSATSKIFDVRTVKYKLPEVLDENFSEFLGLLLADGTVRKSSFSLTKKHIETVERFKQLCINLFNVVDNPIRILNVGGKDFYQFEVCSRHLSHYILNEWCPELVSNLKQVPHIIKQSPLSVQLSFLKGLYEDGTVNIKQSKVDHIEFANKSFTVCQFVQQVLLRVGIACTISKKDNITYLYIYGKYCKLFRDYVGFINKFNQQRLLNYTIIRTDSNSRVPVTKETLLNWYTNKYISYTMYKASLKRGYVTRDYVPSICSDLLDFYYVRIENLVNIELESQCVEVPNAGNFIQNGFVMSNCQGMSLDEAEIDLSKVFEKGQGYVAISRLKTLAGLKVVGLNEMTFSLDSLLLKIDKRLQELSTELEIEYAEERSDLHAQFLLTKYLTKMYR
jgi:intein/homing endonuclease